MSKRREPGTNNAVKVRVMAETSTVEDVAERIIRTLGESDGLEIVDRSTTRAARGREVPYVPHVSV